MKISIKTFACSVAISIVLLACVDTDPDEQAIVQSSSSSIGEMPVMDSRAKFYERFNFWDYAGEFPDNWEYFLGDFGTIRIHIITDKNMLMLAFPHISDSDQVECNYFAIQFLYPSAIRDSWILSQDMILHNITPGNSVGCTATTTPDARAMLVCDDTAEGNLKDKIDIDSIRSYADPDWTCNS